MSELYPHLFEPIQIGPRPAKNRLWMTAHATQLVKDHKFSEEHIAYYAERAKGGVGAITLEAMAVHPTSQPYAGKVLGYDPGVVPNYRRMAEAVHEHGCLLLTQPWHRGRETSGIASRLPVWAPSAIPCTVYREMPHEMTVRDIRELQDGYVAAAHHAAEGGLDGDEVHGLAHGYLLGQFLSPATNHRTDDYGGSDENRLRIVMEIVERTRAEVGPELIVGIRVNGDDGPIEEGLRTPQWAEIARTLTATGLLDYVSTSQGTYQNRMLIYPTAATKSGYQLEATKQIKQAVGDIPVIAVGRITSPGLAEQIVASGTADIVGMARALVADPEFPRKAQEDREQDIRPCVGANWCLTAIVGSPLACVHNPAVGRERDLGIGTLTQASQPRKVAVVGAGPGGLRAALTAAQRGHDVTLIEREQEPGGQVTWITRAGTYREWGSVISWLEAQAQKAGVKMRFSSEASADGLVEEGFDAVVVATGSTPRRHGWSSAHAARWRVGAPVVPGSEGWWVITPREALYDEVEVGPSVLIFDDTGSRQPIVVADYMLERRHKVEIVTPLPQVSPELSTSRDVEAVYRDLRTRGAVFTTDHEIVRIDEDRVTLADVHTGEQVVREPVDAVVLTLGNAAEDGLVHALDGRAELHAIGDCVAPRRIFNAIWEGEQVARAL